MIQYDPDSLHRWVVAVACCFINMMMHGMARLTGVMLVASSSSFQVSRKMASFPYTFAHVIKNCSGPLVGYLGHRFGVMSVTTFGCFLGAAGVGACYLAQDIETVIVLWGVVFGLGFGLGCILLQVSINQYFSKHRATASGISFSGVCLGSFFLPPIIEILLSTYELSGTFLILSGFILNCVPVALLLKKPQFDIRTHKKLHNVENMEKNCISSSMNVNTQKVEKNSSKFMHDLNGETYSRVVLNQLQHPTFVYMKRKRELSTHTLHSENCIHMRTFQPLEGEQFIEHRNEKCHHSVLETEMPNVSSHFIDRNFNSERGYADKCFCLQSEKVQKQISPDISWTSFVSKLFTRSPKLGHENTNYQDMNHSSTKACLRCSSVTQTDVAKEICSLPECKTECFFNICQANADSIKCIPENINIINVKNNSKNFHSSDVYNIEVRDNKIVQISEKITRSKNNKLSVLGSFSIIYDPMFNLISITKAVHVLVVVCIFTIIVDFSRDMNIGETNEKYVLMTVSLADFIGRVSLGWVTDGGYMTTAGFTYVLFACQGVATAAIAWSGEFIALIIVVTLFGLAGGGLIGLFPILIAQYIDHDKQTVAISSSHFLSGPVCLAIPPLIGYFRDHLGAYDYLFYITAILSLLCCFGWMLAPCIARCKKRSPC